MFGGMHVQRLIGKSSNRPSIIRSRACIQNRKLIEANRLIGEYWLVKLIHFRDLYDFSALPDMLLMIFVSVFYQQIWNCSFFLR